MTRLKSLLSLPTVALLVMVLALALVRVGAISPLASFGTFIGAWIVGGLASAAIGAARLLRSSDAELRARARWQLAVGLVLLLGLLVQARGSRVPPIHDITTSPDDPPSFTAAAQLPENQGRDLTYPHGGGDVAALQASGYPDLAPIRLEVPVEQARDMVIESMQQLGWTVTWSSAELGAVEATDTSSLFRFVDDIVARIRADGETGSIVDVRSLSRVGRSDLGANAARIRTLRDLLLR